MLKSAFNIENNLEIGVDECARGPMFGRLYTAGVVLPKIFDHSKMKDSKKIKSQKKMEELANYIKENALAWSVDYIEPQEIDGKILYYFGGGLCWNIEDADFIVKRLEAL